MTEEDPVWEEFNRTKPPIFNPPQTSTVSYEEWLESPIGQKEKAFNDAYPKNAYPLYYSYLNWVRQMPQPSPPDTTKEAAEKDVHRWNVIPPSIMPSEWATGEDEDVCPYCGEKMLAHDYCHHCHHVIRTSSDWMGDAYPGEQPEKTTIRKDYTELQFDDPQEHVEEHFWVLTGNYVLVDNTDLEDVIARMGAQNENRPFAYGSVDFFYNYEAMFSVERTNMAMHVVEKALKRWCKNNEKVFEGILDQEGTLHAKESALNTDEDGLAKEMGWTLAKVNASGHRVYEWTDPEGRTHTVTGYGVHTQREKRFTLDKLRRYMRHCMEGRCNHFPSETQITPEQFAQIEDTPPVYQPGQVVHFGDSDWWIMNIEGDVAHIYNDRGQEEIVSIYDLQPSRTRFKHSDYPGIGDQLPEKMWRRHWDGENIPVDFYGEQTDDFNEDTSWDKNAEMICPRCGEICNSYGDFLVHENREHEHGLGIPESPQPVVDMDDPMPAHFNTNPDTNSDRTIDRLAHRMPNWRKIAADIQDLAEKTRQSLLNREDILKLKAEYDERREQVAQSYGIPNPNPNYHVDLGTKYDLVYSVLLKLRNQYPESYKIWPWAIKQVKRGFGAFFNSEGEYLGPASDENLQAQGDRLEIRTPQFEHFIDIVGQAGKLLHEMRLNNRTPEGFDINRVPNFWELEQWLYSNRSSEDLWEDAEHVYTFPDGWTIDTVRTRNDLDREGEMVQHCVGGYCHPVEAGDSIIYSLRDPKGGSHATIEMSAIQPLAPVNSTVENETGVDLTKKGQTVRQVQGKQNSQPSSEYQAKIREFFEHYMSQNNIELVYDEYGEPYDDDEFYITNPYDVERFWEEWKANPHRFEEGGIAISGEKGPYGLPIGKEQGPIVPEVGDWGQLIRFVVNDQLPSDYQMETKYDESSSLTWKEMTQAIYTLVWLTKEDPHDITNRMQETMDDVYNNWIDYRDEGMRPEDWEWQGVPVDENGWPDTDSPEYEQYERAMEKELYGGAMNMSQYLHGLPFGHGGWQSTTITEPPQRHLFRTFKHPHEWISGQLPLGFDYKEEPRPPAPNEFKSPEEVAQLAQEFYARQRQGANLFNPNKYNAPVNKDYVPPQYPKAMPQQSLNQELYPDAYNAFLSEPNKANPATTLQILEEHGLSRDQAFAVIGEFWIAMKGRNAVAR